MTGRDDINGAVQSLLARLHEADTGGPQATEQQRTERLEAALNDALQQLPEQVRFDAIGGARDWMVDEARTREQRTRELEQNVARMSAEIDGLRRENDALRSGGAGGQPTGPGPSSGDGTEVERLKNGLRKHLGQEMVTGREMGLSPDDEAFFDLISLAIRFTIDAHSAMQVTLGALGIGDAASMDTMMMQRHAQGLRMTVRHAVDGRPGSMQALEEALEQNRRFQVQLGEVYADCLPEAVRSALGDLDPMDILDPHKGRLGADHRAAWNDFVRKHGDLEHMAGGELWERFMGDKIKKELVSRMG